MKRIEVPVLVVGAGPAGLTAALLLARQGIGCRIVERRSGSQRAPAAHVVNARSFEIFRQAGVDAEALRAAAQDPADAGFVYWTTRLGGEVLGRLPYERQGEDALALTPTPLRNLSQHRLEPILVQSLADAGTAPLYGQQWESAEQSSEGVRSRVRDLATGETYEVRSRYLLAADGAGSRIRKWLGIEPIGPDSIQSFVMIHFAADLRPLVRDCPGVLYWICNPECRAILVAHDIDREWVYMHAWDPAREPREHFTPEVCEALVRGALARSDVDLEIRTISSWTMTAQVAERYREGRTFLLGDSAHRFPPTGGMGLNTGVQDAHNLVWKLAAVEAGWAAPSLLDTYEIERRPVAQENADQSLRNAFRLLEVTEALGLSDDVDESRRRMDSVLADAAGRERLAAAIANQAEHFDMLGLQIGFSYEAGALLADGSEKRSAENPVREVVPTSRPGSRLPHGWVTRASGRASTLDLSAFDRLTLLVGPDGSSWIEAARAVGVPMHCLRIGGDVLDPDRWWSGPAEMEAGGALLVRPDQHVAFRSRGSARDPGAALSRAIAAVVGS